MNIKIAVSTLFFLIGYFTIAQEDTTFPNESYPYGFGLLNNKVVFAASDANGNNNIWEYDGVNAPVMVTNYTVSNYSNQLLIRSIIDDELYFWADEGSNLGRELYRYDGINAPIMLDEVSPGPLSSSSQNQSDVVAFDGYIYTGANDWVIGGPFGRGELYRFPSCASFTVTISQNNGVLEADPGYVSYQWYDANGPISGETSNNFTFSTNGTYYCEILNSNNCSAVSNSITVMDAGIETSSISTIRVYPNPTQGSITIESDTPIESVVIQSTAGKVLGIFHETTIDLSHLSRGVYIAQITSNGTTTIRRIVKQ